MSLAQPAKTKPIATEQLKHRELHEVMLSEQRLQGMLAWALSFILHVLVLFVLAALLVFVPGGTGGDKSEDIDTSMIYEMAVAIEVSGDQFLTEESGGGASGGKTAETESAAASLPGSDSAPMNSSAVLEGLLPTNDGPPGGKGNAAGGLGLGNGGAQLGAGGGIQKVKTKVFGIEGEGRRFVYVFDRSDSMNGYEGRPFAVAKAELQKSLESLNEAHEFQIIFYNDAPLAFGGSDSNSPRLMLGSEHQKKTATDFVRDIQATGGTQHLRALRMALSLNPDVIFFLTDADKPALRQRDIEDLQSRASRSSTAIHSIQFGEGPNQNSGNWIENLAVGTSGKYRYINVSQLSP
ncbi:MAG: hypothetical protein SFV81_05010 [Pirellulaceae bacterium]|nr:hypothetical protein [Pirellulaceae bacterium]